MAKFTPFFDRVLVMRDIPLTKTSSGLIHIPDVAQKRTGTGKTTACGGVVIDVGPDVEDVSAGDLVAFDKYAGEDIQIDGVDHVVLKCEDVLGVMDAPLVQI